VDTAVAVHTKDERYTDLVGRTVVLPLVGREIPIIADEYSDPEKGSGAVKITPAHELQTTTRWAAPRAPADQYLRRKRELEHNVPHALSRSRPVHRHAARPSPTLESH